jgi:esterase/lipase
MIKLILKALKYTFLILLTIVATIIIVRAFDARRMPDLEIWHTAKLESEFRADQADDMITFEAYRENEARLFQERNQKVFQLAPRIAEYRLSRYFPDGRNNPKEFPVNWNRSFEMIPSEIKGGALLLHGLTDSPYSLRSVAQILAGENIYVLGLRLPGHGTIPAGIASATWRDWMAAVHIGVRHVLSQTGEQKPFFIVGYSNGAALALKYTLDALEDSASAMPDQLILLSPAVGVTPFGFFAGWHKILGFIPFFEKFRWQSIGPEYDPYKYNSFPKHAGQQTFQLTIAVQKQTDTLKKMGRLSSFPSTLTFQSLVDDTVRTDAITDRFYDKLEGFHHELVLFDINRMAQTRSFFKSDNRELIENLEERSGLPYRLTVITNKDEDSREVVAKTRKTGFNEVSIISLGLSWPAGVYSLSHVALPFPPNDSIYGQRPERSAKSAVNLGTLEPRGEKGVLRVSLNQLMRLRYNPFFRYIEERIIETVRKHMTGGEEVKTR